MRLVQASLLNDEWEQEEFKRNIKPAEKLLKFEPVKLDSKKRCADCGRGMSLYVSIGNKYYHYDVLDCAASFTSGTMKDTSSDQCSEDVETWYVGGIGLDRVLISSIDQNALTEKIECDLI